MRAGVFGVATSTGDGGERLEKQKQNQARQGCVYECCVLQLRGIEPSHVCGWWVILFQTALERDDGFYNRGAVATVEAIAAALCFLVSFLYRFVSFRFRAL